MPNRFVISEEDEIHFLERSAVYLLPFQYTVGNAEVITKGQSCQTKAGGKAKPSPYICIFWKPVDIPSAWSLYVPDHNFEALEI